MKNGFADMCEESTAGSREEAEDGKSDFPEGLWREDEIKMPVNNFSSELETDLCINVADRDNKECNPYSHYLKQAETGENLQDLVKHLVTVLGDKDKEIGMLKKEQVQV